ncbi:MBL fold metallo-hydrolase [Lachnospiraceae bacterium]|nr:MBL fold metallo-hydrolase [Lachnospiraceae bacterium]
MDIYNAGNRVMNTYIYHTLEGYIMIDTGYEHSLKKVEKRANKQGITLSEVKYVFLTHAHDDHAGFLNELLSKYSDIKVIIHSRAMPVLLRGQNSFVGGCSSLIAFVFCKFMGLIGKGKHLFPAIDKQNIDRFIEILPSSLANEETILQGKILFTPGHTSDSISLKIGNKIFCGDAAMNGLPSFKRVTIWIENKNAFRNSWNMLLDEKADLIFPAHGKPFRQEELKKYINHIPKIKLYRLK